MIEKIKRFLSQNPHSTGQTIFDATDVNSVSKRTRNRIHKSMADQRSPTKCPPLSETNAKKKTFVGYKKS